VRFGWIGFHVEGLPALRSLLQQGVPIEAVITLSPEAAAKRSGVADYATVCGQLGVPLYQVADINAEESVRLLRQLDLDVVFVIGWSQIIRGEALRSARMGMIGAHASLLPHNRGSAPINWALIRGERQTGNSLLWLAEGVDAGDIIDQTPICITPYDTCASLYERVAESNRDMLLRVVPRLIAGERVGTRQLHTDEPVLPRRRPSDGLIDWRNESGAVYNFVRALTRPYPGAFSFVEGRRWTIWQSALLPSSHGLTAAPGEILGPVVSPVSEACGQAVACGAGAIILLEVEADDGEVLAGRRLSDQPWSGKRWTNG
jgi:methionyl-tRNA formyltransferase